MSDKIIFGQDLIDFLEKEGLHEYSSDFEQHKDYSTMEYCYTKPHRLLPQTPRVEFTVDADNDAFIGGMYYTEGTKGYGVEFDSLKDMKYFFKNADWESDVIEKKSLKESKDSDFFDEMAKKWKFSKDEAKRYKDKTYISAIGVMFDRVKKTNPHKDAWYGAMNDLWECIQTAKENGFDVSYEEKQYDKIIMTPNYNESLKEGINDELLGRSEDGEHALYFTNALEAEHGKDPHYEFSLAENGYLANSVRTDEKDCEKVVMDWIKKYGIDVDKSEVKELIGKKVESLKESSKTDRLLELAWDGLVTKGEYDVDERLSLYDFEGGLTDNFVFYIKPSAFDKFPKKHPSTNTWNCKGLVKWHDGDWKDITIACSLPQDYVLESMGIEWDDITSKMLLVKYVFLD